MLALTERHVAEAAHETEVVAARLRSSPPDIESVVRTIVAAGVALNGGGRDQQYRVLFAEAPRTPALRAALDQLHTRIAAEMVHHLRRLSLGGDDPELVARVVVHTVDSLVHEVVLRPPEGRSVEACVEEVVACVLRYLQGSGPSRSTASGTARHSGSNRAA